ncbi:MAG: CoA transferase [Dehalococcoidia bacterium]|nr:CoA transferase [Dehalococcoidia bacterium]
MKYPGPPHMFSDPHWQIHRPAPRLGEHNQEIYCGRLGMSKEELVLLRETGVI